jgi:hypothetical protein
MTSMERNRYQFSVRTLLLLTLVSALLLVPVAWVTRERRQMMLAQEAMLRAREMALRSAVLEEKRRADQRAAQVAADACSSTVDRLERENASLKQQVNALHRELKQLKDPAPTSSGPKG